MRFICVTFLGNYGHKVCSKIFIVNCRRAAIGTAIYIYREYMYILPGIDPLMGIVCGNRWVSRGTSIIIMCSGPGPGPTPQSNVQKVFLIKKLFRNFIILSLALSLESCPAVVVVAVILQVRVHCHRARELSSTGVTMSIKQTSQDSASAPNTPTSNYF